MTIFSRLFGSHNVATVIQKHITLLQGRYTDYDHEDYPESVSQSIIEELGLPCGWNEGANATSDQVCIAEKVIEYCESRHPYMTGGLKRNNPEEMREIREYRQARGFDGSPRGTLNEAGDVLRAYIINVIARIH